jgi:hypothetical protein
MDGMRERWIDELRDYVRRLAGNIVIRLADLAGATYVSIRNSDGTEVARFTSTGQLISRVAGGGNWAGFGTESAAPGFYLLETDQGTDEKLWDVLVNGKTFKLRAVNDANSVATDALTIARGTGTAVSYVEMASGARLPRSSGSAVFAVDATSTGSSVTLNNLAAVAPFGNANNFSGLLVVHETAVNGVTALFLCGGGGAKLIMESAVGYYSVAAGTANRANVYYNGSLALEVENRQGGSRTFNIFAIRTRAAA